MAKESSVKSTPSTRHSPITPRRSNTRPSNSGLEPLTDYTSVHGESPSPHPRIMENDTTPTAPTMHQASLSLSIPPSQPVFMDEDSPQSDTSGLSLESFPTNPSPISEQGVAQSMHAPTPPIAGLSNVMIDHSTPLPETPAPAPASAPATPAATPVANNILAHLAVAQANLDITQEVHTSLTKPITRINLPTQDIASAALAGPPYFTPTPEDGWPLIHMAHSAQMFDFLDPAVINAWIAVPDPKLLVRVLDNDGKDPVNTTPILTERICFAIGKVASLNNLSADSIRVSPPAKANNSANPGNPLSFLVYNLPEHLKGILISRKIWSSQRITFEARDFLALSMPTLLFALQGFTSRSTAGEIHKIIFDAWALNDTRAELADLFTEAGVPQGQLRDTIVEFIQSIDVKRVEWKITGGTSLPRYNIFAHSPISDPAVWTKIRLFLRNLNYSAPLEGSGFYTAFVPCQICNSLDHPRGLCPFPAIENWNGPVIQMRPRTNTMRGRGRGRGMGRGSFN
ncbi:hypothetical protein BJ138DRAFT_1119993 [Hygrophoropsis aurantiaca]|uniref:Uncharacterized protein n=1 Tax=Hygrophoropsis aurantiaca TaxID=72124 RepID=A0ACB7ZT24_9AGAM|nr:hypothetical protein BJ138DRAFT_1119993 [Hygrophoropsis aurantiaca]